MFKRVEIFGIFTIGNVISSTKGGSVNNKSTGNTVMHLVAARAGSLKEGDPVELLCGERKPHKYNPPKEGVRYVTCKCCFNRIGAVSEGLTSLEVTPFKSKRSRKKRRASRK